jgi:hypothetical protein
MSSIAPASPRQRAWPLSRFRRAGLPQLDQLALEVGLQMGTVVTLESSQLFDLLLQHAALAIELLKQLGPLPLGLGDKALGLGDERVMLGLAGG